MKTKIVVSLLALLLMVSSHIHAQDYLGKSVEMLGKLKVEDDDQTFMRCSAAIDYDRSISDEVRLQLRVKYLIIGHQFLKTHTKPEGPSFWNVAPPDGGIPGSDPSSVKDPVLRAKYVKMIAENDALSEAQNKHTSLSTSCPRITSAIVGFINKKKENLKTVSDLLNHHTKTKEEAKELKDLIDQAAFESGHKKPAWDDVAK